MVQRFRGGQDGGGQDIGGQDRDKENNNVTRTRIKQVISNADPMIMR